MNRAHSHDAVTTDSRAGPAIPEFYTALYVLFALPFLADAGRDDAGCAVSGAPSPAAAGGRSLRYMTCERRIGTHAP